jgi:hypothetical protein
MRQLFLAVIMVLLLIGQASAWPGLCDCYGGDEEEGDWWYLLDYDGYPLEDGDWVYAAWAGPDGEIDPPNVHGYPTDDDLLLQYQSMNYIEYSMFYITLTTFPPGDARDRRPQYHDLIYCRMFDGPEGSIRPPNYYGDSQLYEVKYWPFEEFFCLFPGDPGGGHTDTPIKGSGWKEMTVYGGLDTTDMSYWPLTDGEGQQLEDGDLVQLIWAGPNGLVDPLNELNGRPGGDDHLLTELRIGQGVEGTGTGRFEYDLCTFESDDHPCQGDVIFIRIFNGARCDQSTYYGDSDVHLVAHESGEVYSSFADDADDAVMTNPSFTAVEEWTAPEQTVPHDYVLLQNYPNPFNASTEIRYALPVAGPISLRVYNVRGQEVVALAEGWREVGDHVVAWNGRDRFGKELSSGIYFCRLQAEGHSETVKMVLLR